MTNVKLFAFDQDADAIAAAKEKLKHYTNINYIHNNFSHLKKHIKTPVDGILFDLGVSSHQIDAGQRGFSMREDGPLDMRMDQDQKLTAAEIINHYPKEELEKIFFAFGEERFSRRVAAAIIKKRPLKTTFELKAVVEKAIPTWKKRESVTRIFQALRIAVNQELDNLKLALQDAIDLLKPGGRMVVISYHSLEDRIVKQTFKSAPLKILTKKPLAASAEETALNPRAKSAKMRAGEKL
jgi:16S rRNA (cytosine1402-N4)-methyltransferase